MKKNLILTIIVILFYRISNAQFSVGCDFGFNINHLDTDISNRSFTKNTNKIGYNTSLLIDYKISKSINIQTGFSFIEKNYSLERTGYYEGIFQSFNNIYMQMEFFSQIKALQLNRLQLKLNTGTYTAFWCQSQINGVIPNIYDTNNEIDNNGVVIQNFNLTKYSENYEFNKVKDNRIEFGLISGLDLIYNITIKNRAFFRANYYFSLTDQQKKYMAIQNSRINKTISFSFGFMYNLL